MLMPSVPSAQEQYRFTAGCVGNLRGGISQSSPGIVTVFSFATTLQNSSSLGITQASLVLPSLVRHFKEPSAFATRVILPR